MTNPISKLSKLDSLKPSDLNCNLFTVYDYDGESIQELLCQFFTKINECVDISNATFKLAEWLVNEGLAQEVAHKLEVWLGDGTLANIINQTIFNELNEKINKARFNLDNFGFINVKDLGAVGDGNSHKLSSKYATLLLAQADYPSATSLDDEIDTQAIIKAISNFKSVYIPSGYYEIDKMIDVDKRTEIFGDGKTKTELRSRLTAGAVFHIKENGHRCTFRDMWIGSKIKGDLINGSNVNTRCFVVSAPYVNFRDMELYNFDTIFKFEEGKCWVHRIDNCFMVYANYGVFGNREFNDIVIRGCNVTYCKTGMFMGEGRSKHIVNNDIERNDISVQVSNTGDCTIEGNYFELEKECAIKVDYSQTSPDMVNIINNNFFAQQVPSSFIKYHARQGAYINIDGNTFVGSTGVTETVNCLEKINSGTLVRPRFQNNYLNDKSLKGVDYPTLNDSDYNNYTLGYRLDQSTNPDLTSYNVDDVASVRIGFNSGTTIKLPSFRNSKNLRRCFKLVAFGSGDGAMPIDTATVAPIGLGSIEPNQMYSVYYNRIVDGKEEVLICKG